MFAVHQPLIGAYAVDSPRALADVVAFVLTSIRKPLWRAAADMSLIRSGNLAPLALPFTREGFEFVKRHRRKLYRDAFARRADAAALVELFSTVPGLGLPKAGFVAQLAFGLGGCIDTHNLKRFGLNPNRWHTSAKTAPHIRSRKAADYAAVCDRLGGCAFLWDSWCEYVAANSHGARLHYRDAFDVSATHCRAFELTEAR